MKRFPFLLTLPLLGLSACGHDVYQRDGTTSAQYMQDENACFAYADRQPPAAVGYVEGGYSMNVEKERQDLRACMEAKGYSLQPKWPFGPYGTSPTTGPDPANGVLATRE